MKQSLRASVGSVLVAVGTRMGAVVLLIATMAAIVFALLNFDQRVRFESPDDGVSWRDTDHGIVAQQVLASSPAEKVGIHAGDRLLEVSGVTVYRALDVTKKLWHAGLWTQVRYKLARNGEEFETSLVLAPADKPASIENYLRFAGLLYLFIGFFILWKRWNGPRAIHFYVFCLVSFIFCSFHYSGKLDAFDFEVYWVGIVARLLAPTLLLHVALGFPERTEPASRSLRNWFLIYSAPIVFLAVHVFVAGGSLGFMPWLGSRIVLDKAELGYFGLCYLATGLIFYGSYRNAPSGVLRQQLKWLMGGTVVGSLPCVLFYILPFVFGTTLAVWLKFSVLSLVLIPLCFGYAIIRYLLMDVDIILNRGLAYTAATAGVLVVFFALIGLSGLVVHRQANGKWGRVLAIVIAASIF